MIRIFLVFIFLLAGGLGLAQDTLSAIPINSTRYNIGLDTYIHQEWKSDYEEIYLSDGRLYRIPYVSIAEHKQDTLVFTLSGNYRKSSIQIRINDTLDVTQIVDFRQDTMVVVLPPNDDAYQLKVFHEEELIGAVNVKIYPIQWEQVVIVPLVKMELKRDSLQDYLNKIYKQALTNFHVKVKPLFIPSEMDGEVFSNPSPDHDRYTEQMILLRDAYFDHHPNRNKGAYYLFVVPGFTNEDISGYMVKNKGVGFIKYDTTSLFYEVAKQLGFGAGVLDQSWKNEGPKKGTTQNLMDDQGSTHLRFSQWESIQHSVHSVSYFDDYEDVRTNNGLIAYYFWEEDENGKIHFKQNLLTSIKRPFKRNQYSQHLEITNWFFTPIFYVFKFKISALHILVFMLSFGGGFFLRKRIFQWLNLKRNNGSRLLKFGGRTLIFTMSVILFYGLFMFINEGYHQFEVKSGKLRYLWGASIKTAIKEVGNSQNPIRIQEKKRGSEVLIKQGGDWFLKRRKNVLYFDVRMDGKQWSDCEFKTHSDTLHVVTKGFKEYAESHYMVFNYIGADEKCHYQKVFNHIGKEITDKISINDPAKRILLFVNGYRPTSTGKSFEENFADIQKNGLEFENSKNIVYDFDRYDYWRPWKEIDLLFQQRLNPSETFYADGHFSVTTSNHQSLFGFTALSNAYPKRCKDLNNHVCQKTVKSWGMFGITTQSNTVEMLPSKPNKSGFKKRVQNGKVAGRNLLQTFNELPNKSENDTLYIVAHSMGYAYSLGIIEELRGKINFGGFYIMAPENASAGKVNASEWKEIWQYGSDQERYGYIAPCLLDGIAPQTKARNLPPSNQIFIPEDLNKRMGFFNAHFIGYYTWLFNLKEGEKGHITQH